jgi:molybdopterin-binding protein
VAHFGNRARIAIGPLVAEITGAAVAGLGLAPGDVAVATFKATATRLLPIDAP